jgi:NACHT conflict system protein/NACHT domain-containing protein
LTGTEAALLSLATAGVKSAAKLWLGDRNVAGDVAADAIEIASNKLASEVDRRKLRRIYDQISESVYERLQPLLETEYSSAPENELLATVAAVQDTFTRAALTDADLFAVDLDPAYLDRFLRSKVHGLTDLLSADATYLYNLMLREMCSHVVEVARALPKFSSGAATEILCRETEILVAVDRVLDRLPRRRSATDFEHEYRHHAISRLDRIEIFGATLDDSSREYPLSVAFISLTAVHGDDTSPYAEPAAGGQPIEQLLCKTKRLFIRADADLGKTTLLQWMAVRSAKQDFDPPLEDWNSCVPFFVPLRRYAESDLPDAGAFVKNIGAHIDDEMPNGWVQQQLRSGRGVVLIDGVDELPVKRRRDVKRRLRDLTTAFP